MLKTQKPTNLQSVPFERSESQRLSSVILTAWRVIVVASFFLLVAEVTGVMAQPTSQVISALKVTGNVKTEESLILWTGGLKAGGRLVTESVQSAIRNLYRLGVFSDVQIYASPGNTQEEVALEIVVKELPALAKIEFKGNKKIKRDDLKKAIKLVEGQMLSPKNLVDSQRKILSLYEEKGYTLAKVKADTAYTAVGREVNLLFTIEEGEHVQVRRILIEGNTAFSAKELKKQMKTKEDRWYRNGDFKREVYRDDLNLLEAYYRKKGFKDARIVKDSLSYGESRKDLFLYLMIDEGERYTFGTIGWEGNDLLKNDEIRKRIVVKTGTSFDQEQYAVSYTNIVSMYGEQGYLNARVVPEEQSVGRQVNITFKIDEGTPSRVKTITIEGNTKTKDIVIRRELSLKPGQVFKQSVWERSVRDVYQLNFFKNIEPDRRVDEHNDVDLILKVEERSTGTASLGAGYSGRDRLVGTAGVSVPNLMGNGQALDFNWEFGTRRKTLRLGFTEPWFLNSPTIASCTIFRQTRYFGGYDSQGQTRSDGFDYLEEGGSISVGRRVNWPDSYSHMSGTYRVERFEYMNFDSTYQGSYRQYEGKRSRIASLALTYRRDSRDLPMFPTRGSRISYTPEMAAKWFGSTQNYQKHLVDADFYIPTIWKLVAGVHARVGVVKGFARTTFNDIPFLEKFTPGGVDFDGIIRGYADRSIGPRDSTGNIEGGNVMTVFNFEYQFPIARQQVYGMVFADAGSAWRRIGDLDPRDLRKSVGAGIRVMAPMLGLIGFDFAYGFDQPKIDGGKARWRTHFQFGPQFY